MDLWLALFSGALGAAFYYWLGTRDGRVGMIGARAGARATGILLLVGVALFASARSAGIVATALAAGYLVGWFRGKAPATSA